MTRLLSVYQVAVALGVMPATIRVRLLRSNLRRGGFLSASTAVAPSSVFAFGGDEQVHAAKDLANAPLE